MKWPEHHRYAKAALLHATSQKNPTTFKVVDTYRSVPLTDVSLRWLEVQFLGSKDTLWKVGFDPYWAEDLSEKSLRRAEVSKGEKTNTPSRFSTR